MESNFKLLMNEFCSKFTPISIELTIFLSPFPFFFCG